MINADQVHMPTSDLTIGCQNKRDVCLSISHAGGVETETDETKKERFAAVRRQKKTSPELVLDFTKLKQRTVTIVRVLIVIRIICSSPCQVFHSML